MFAVLRMTCRYWLKLSSRPYLYIHKCRAVVMRSASTAGRFFSVIAAHQLSNQHQVTQMQVGGLITSYHQTGFAYVTIGSVSMSPNNAFYKALD